MKTNTPKKNKPHLYTGSILKIGNRFYWRYTGTNGKYTKQVIKDSLGIPVTTKTEAEKLVISYSQEREAIKRIDSKRELIEEIAQIKNLLKVQRVPLTELEQSYLNHPARQDGQQESKCSAIRDFVAYIQRWNTKQSNGCGYDDTSKIDGFIVQEYLNWYYRTGVTSHSYNSRLSCLKVIFDLFRDKEDNPFRGIPKRKECSKPRESFSLEQLNSIWNTLQDPTFHLLYKQEMTLLYTMALHTGARCGDLCLLTWQEINFENRSISFIPRKTSHSSKQSVVLPLNDVLLPVLTEWKMKLDTASKSLNVLPNVAKRYMANPTGIYRDTLKVFQASGIQTNWEDGVEDNLQGCNSGRKQRMEQRQRKAVRYSFHSFRHTFASILIEKGANQVTVSRMLGHSTIAMTNRYIHIADDTKREAVNALTEIIPCEYSTKQAVQKIELQKQLLSLIIQSSDETKNTVLEFLLNRVPEELLLQLQNMMDSLQMKKQNKVQ